MVMKEVLNHISDKPLISRVTKHNRKTEIRLSSEQKETMSKTRQ